MGLLDNFKAKLGPAKDKVSDLAQQHEDAPYGVGYVVATWS
jgi:hypothetical protein